MSSRRPISWFLTDNGRRFSFGLLTTFGVGATALKFTPNTILLYKYKELVHYYSNGKPVSLTPELEDRVKTCMDKLEMAEVHRKLVQPFSVFGYDLFNAGSIKSKFGAAIGIPANFTYKSIADIQNNDIQVNLKSVDWSSEAGQKLADALLLSDKVQEFAICREILSTNNSKVFLDSVYPVIGVLITYTISQAVNQRLNLYTAPVAFRTFFYTIATLFGIGLYFLLKDYTEVHYETMVDKRLCDLGPDFVESGVIFYNKLLKRNQALRELMGKEGEKKYSKLGNENFFIRQPRIALVHRKQYFEERLMQLKESDEIQNGEL